jgi:uncharacterized protein YndB with AHSA1/START domain
MKVPDLGPIHRTVWVSSDTEAAYRRFTERFGDWWPVRTHSIGGRRTRRVVFETRAGGRIYEELADGRRFQWGRLLALDPPRRLLFTWHPSRDPETAQQVEVAFAPEGAGTRVTLTASGWERWGPGASRARRGYRVGWGYVLNVWAGRRTAGMALLDVLMGGAMAVQTLRGGRDAAIARAEGEIREGA